MMEMLLIGMINPPPPSFPRQTCSENTNWDNAALYMSVDEEAIRKSTGGSIQ